MSSYGSHFAMATLFYTILTMLLLDIYSANPMVYNNQFNPSKQYNKLPNLDPTGAKTDMDLEHKPSKCRLNMIESSRGLFRHIVYYGDLNFVYLHIKLGEDISFRENRHIISPTVWTWTFHGKDGALEFLSWPFEFGAWSMGLLNSYVGTIKVKLEKAKHSGDCRNLTIGNSRDNTVVAKVLLQAVQALIEMGEDEAETYGPSQICYRERVNINPSSMYFMCKHILCPFEAMRYVCCPNSYIPKYNNRTLSCARPFRFSYDDLWWVCPIIASLILFIYTPLVLMRIASYCTTTNRRITSDSDYETICNQTDFVFYDGDTHVTLFKILFSPVIYLFIRFESLSARMIRFLLPWMSLSLIGIQVYIDRYHLKKQVLDMLKSNVPLGFRSMLAGYQESAKLFLPFLGGPFVALGIYLIIACGLVTLPRSFAEHLESGLPDNKTPTTVLCLNSVEKEKYCNIDIKHCYGFRKIYHVLVAQFFMLLNKRYWMDSVGIQKLRWQSWNRSMYHAICLPIFLITCLIEHVLCVIFFGLPIVFFSYVIVCSYYKYIIQIKKAKVLRRCSFIMIPLLILFLVVSMVLFLYMFCVIFLDGCLFLTRLFIFTYTGIMLYPKSSYGYIIFSLTSIYYLWESVKNFSLKYDQLLKTTIKMCKLFQRANDREKLVIKVGLFSGVREYVYEFVIERMYPRRKHVFLALFKLAIILSAIGVSMSLLRKTDSLRELHILVHVATAIFTCAIPKLTRSIFEKPMDKLKKKMFEDRIRKILAELFSDSSLHSYTEEHEP